MEARGSKVQGCPQQQSSVQSQPRPQETSDSTKLLELHTLKIRLSKYKEAFLSQMLGTALDELGNELKHYTKN